MKRNKNLVQLSRDHHYGLLLGWKIKQGLKLNVPVSELVEYIDHFSREELLEHFKEEEEDVLTFLDPEDRFRKRTEEEHNRIRNIISRITGSDDVSIEPILELTELLEDHIRFEERELFPYLEQVLPEEQLEKMGEILRSKHKPYVEVYHNEFWNNK